MKLLFDFFPIIIFFIAFKIGGIYVATAVFLAATVGQITIQFIIYRKFEQLHLITFALGFILGGATLLLHDEMFIKWKPTAIYWAFASIFLITHFWGKKNLLQRMMDSNINLPKHVWNRLNISWTIFFTLMGFLNIYVVYHYSTDTWVNFKVFGVLGLTIVFIIIQALYMGTYIKTEEVSDDK